MPRACRAPKAPSNQNEDNKENQISDPKLDLKNCLTFVKNQCGIHTKNEMAKLLNISRSTFFQKIKGLTVDPDNKINEQCEFCLRKRKNDIVPSPSVEVITNEMKEYLNNACNKNKTAEMARKLEIKPHTLQMYLSRNDIVFSNTDPTKCHFCVPVNNPYLTTLRNRQPVINMIKKLAIEENQTELGIISKIAVTMLYHSNRRASQIFQKVGENPEQFVSNFKFAFPKRKQFK